MVEAVKKNVFRYRYLILAVITLCYMIQYVDRVKTNTLMPFISKDIGMAAVQIGLGSALMMLFYGPSQWFTGWLCDKIGSKKVLVFSIIAWSVLTGWMAEMRSITEWYVRMALFGILIGTEFVPSARLLVRWFPPKQRAMAQSVLSWAWIITPAWAPLLATAMYTALGNNWRMVFVILAIAGIIPLVLMLSLIFDRPEKCRFVSKEEIKEAYSEELERGLITEKDIDEENFGQIEQKAKSGNISFKQILSTKGFFPMVIVIIIAQQMLWGVLTWSAQYLSQVHAFSVMKMGAWACVYFIGGALGSFLSSYISDRFLGGRRKPMIFLCFACAIPFVIILATIQKGVSPYLLLLTLTGAGFFSNMVWGPALTIPADLFPAEVYGKAMGFTNCFGYMLAAACPYIMGALIKIDPATKTANYFWAWMYIAFTAVIGIAAAYFLVDKQRSGSSKTKVGAAH